MQKKSLDTKVIFREMTSTFSLSFDDNFLRNFYNLLIKFLINELGNIYFFVKTKLYLDINTFLEVQTTYFFDK